MSYNISKKLIKFNCPNCLHSYSVSNKYAGRSAKCKKCGYKLVVPKEKRKNIIPILVIFFAIIILIVVLYFTLPIKPDVTASKIRNSQSLDQHENKRMINNIEVVEIDGFDWTTKNLNVDTFRNGDPIPEAKTKEDWELAGENFQPAWCYLYNDQKNGEKTGKLYNWYAVIDKRGLAPRGWKIPSNYEWGQFVKFLEGENTGLALKSSIGKGKDTCGFSAVPSGRRNSDGEFIEEEKSNIIFWSSSDSETSIHLASSLFLFDEGGASIVTFYNKSAGVPVRLVSTQPKSIKIGDQVWSTRNLDVDTFRNGDPIPEIDNEKDWINAGETQKPASCYYFDDKDHQAKFGKLYNWYAINDPRGLAPEGWHVPTENEWKKLEEYYNKLLSTSETWKTQKDRWALKGDKSTDIGFQALLGGGYFIDYGKSYNYAIGKYVGQHGYFWSSTPYYKDKYNEGANYRLVAYGSPGIMDGFTNKAFGFSVRLVKD